MISPNSVAEVFELSVLSETFCNFSDMKFENYIGPLENLITDQHYRDQWCKTWCRF
jgi:hypothetical protein